MGHLFKLSVRSHSNNYNTSYIMLKALIFALLVVSAVALPHRSKKVKSAHVPKHPKVPIVEDHPVEAAAEPLVAVEVAVAVAVEEDPAPAEEEPAAEEEPVVEEEPAPVKSHPAKKAHKKHYTPKK